MFRSVVSEEKSKYVSANQSPGRLYCFLDQPEKHKLARGRWELAFCQVSLNSVQWFHRRSKKMSQPIRRQGGYPVFLISPKNASMVEDVEILLLCKFCWDLFSSFREKVENVSANHRPGRPFCFSDPLEKHKLGRGRRDLASYQVSSNSFHSFRENVSANQMLGRPFCFFPICLKKHKRGRRHWELASCQVLLNSVQRFQRRSRKWLSQSEDRAVILFFRSAQKTQTWSRALRSCFLSSFIEFRSAVSEEKSKMSRPIRGQGGHLVFPIGPKNTNLVEGV